MKNPDSGQRTPPRAAPVKMGPPTPLPPMSKKDRARIQGEILTELFENRAKLERIEAWLAKVDPTPEKNGDQFVELRAILHPEQT